MREEPTPRLVCNSASSGNACGTAQAIFLNHVTKDGEAFDEASGALPLEEPMRQ